MNKNKIYRLAVNESYFEEIDSEEKAYYLGFIAGDGNINRNEIRLRNVYSDIEILENFKRLIGSQHPIRKINLKNGKCQAHLIFRSSKMKKDLSKYGVISNKSLSLKLSIFIQNIPIQYMNAFLLGLFDADGSIFYSEFERKTGNRKGEVVKKYAFSFTSNFDFCNQLKEYLEQHHNLKVSLTRKKNNKHLAIIQLYRKSDIIMLNKLLYSSPVLKDLGLKRKQNLFKKASEFYSKL